MQEGWLCDICERVHRNTTKVCPFTKSRAIFDREIDGYIDSYDRSEDAQFIEEIVQRRKETFSDGET